MLKGSEQYLVRPNKKISVFRVKGLKTLGRVGTHIKKNIIFSHKIYWAKKETPPIRLKILHVK